MEQRDSTVKVWAKKHIVNICLVSVILVMVIVFAFVMVKITRQTKDDQALSSLMALVKQNGGQIVEAGGRALYQKPQYIYTVVWDAGQVRHTSLWIDGVFFGDMVQTLVSSNQTGGSK